MIKKVALALPFIALLIYLIMDNSVNADAAYKKALQAERRQKNQAFRSTENSPLSPAQQAAFDSLKYYEATPVLAVEGQLSQNASADTVMMLMSDGRSEKYLRWGKAVFSLPDHDKQQLTLFQKAAGSDSTLFVPFTDLTNGHETYGGGRYLDVPLPTANTNAIALDFNRAYNPYCAYSDQYSCPQPPAENRLGVAIRAGEKSFHD